MNFNSEIKEITAREILDSRGTPTVEASVILESGAIGVASVPSGASTGFHEAKELRDREERMHGKGVLGAVDSVKSKIAPSLIGVSAFDQERADSIMITLDGTKNKSNLGANAILSVSLAVARAAAAHARLPLYRYLGGMLKNTLPIPMMNILNGGAHANNSIDIQEFMIVPHGAENITEAVRMGAEIYFHLKKLLADTGHSVAVGDEGGFAPSLENEREVIELILKSVERAGLKPGSDVSLALDVAASEWYDSDKKCYTMPKSKRSFTHSELCEMLDSLRREYPILSIEDGMGEDDVEGWQTLTERMKDDTLLVGDDLFVTNKKRLIIGKTQKIANAILIKPNQIGTLSEVRETVDYAKANGYKTVMSHRSGETADTFIADLSVAFGTELIKTGAPARSERVEKYNRLMKIESELFAPSYAGELF
ncbi:MAG: phosphopyruvate hydratase [Ruminococcaceae bacterium]|nr:phosphopyruvate hydratase [Oscillospiraceae bacterium]